MYNFSNRDCENVQHFLFDFNTDLYKKQAIDFILQHLAKKINFRSNF